MLNTLIMPKKTANWVILNWQFFNFSFRIDLNFLSADKGKTLNFLAKLFLSFVLVKYGANKS